MTHAVDSGGDIGYPCAVDSLILMDGPALVAALSLIGVLWWRRPSRWPALAILGVVAVSCGHVTVALAAMSGALALAPGQRRRGVALGVLLVVTLASAWWAWRHGAGLGALPQARSIVQLRALGALAALLLVIPLLSGAPRFVAAGAWIWLLLRFAAPLWPEGLAILSPWLAWGAGGLAAIGGLAAWARPGASGVTLFGIATLGVLTGSGLGLGGSALLAGALVLQAGLEPWWRAAVLAPGLGLAGLVACLFAAVHGIGPIPLAYPALPALLGAGLALGGGLAALRWRRRSGPAPWAMLGLSLALGIAPLVGLALPGAEAAAARAGRRAIPPDDVAGWRRLERLRRHRPAPADAGVTAATGAP